MDDKPPALSGKPATQMMKENLEALHKAREAFIASEHSERIRRTSELQGKSNTLKATMYTTKEMIVMNGKVLALYLVRTHNKSLSNMEATVFVSTLV